MDLLFADARGNFCDFPGLLALGRRGNNFLSPGPKDMIPLPKGGTLVMVPGRMPVGINPENGEVEALDTDPYQQKLKAVYALAALLPQGYTRTFLPAWYSEGQEQPLPLMGYTMVASQEGKIYCAAIKTDEDKYWNPQHFNTTDLEKRVAEMRRSYPKNRILKQLGKCALEYACFTAQNIFYQRWEGGIPVSPVCNANCLGCISLQPAECCPSPQQRIDFIPTPQEIFEIGYNHLQKGPQPIISFGQGCEGEPSLQADTIAEAIILIRSKTKKGTININTNGGYTKGIAKLIQVGLNHARVSLISALPDTYAAYYRPGNYSLTDVKATLEILAQNKVYTALNLLTFPGLTDRLQEMQALIELINTYKIKQVQYRNLNYDPDLLFKLLPSEQPSAGIYTLLKTLKKECPNTTFGNYTHAGSKR